MENGKVNGHANGSVPGSTKDSSPAEAEVDLHPSPDGTKQSFLPLEQAEKGQAKASVVEVFKKVRPNSKLLFAC